MSIEEDLFHVDSFDSFPMKNIFMLLNVVPVHLAVYDVFPDGKTRFKTLRGLGDESHLLGFRLVNKHIFSSSFKNHLICLSHWVIRSFLMLVNL